MQNNQNSDFDSLLEISRNKLKLGDRIASIYRFLESKHLNSESIKKIILIIEKEKKEKDKQEAPSKLKKEKKDLLIAGIFWLILGSFIFLISYFLYNKAFEAGVIAFLPLSGVIIGGLTVIKGLIAFIRSFTKKV